MKTIGYDLLGLDSIGTEVILNHVLLLWHHQQRLELNNYNAWNPMVSHRSPTLFEGI